MPEGPGKLLLLGASAVVTLLLVRRLRQHPPTEDLCDHVHWAAPSPPLPAPSASAEDPQRPSAVRTATPVALLLAALLTSVAAVAAIVSRVPGGPLTASALVACTAVISFLLGVFSVDGPSQPVSPDMTSDTLAAPPAPGTPALWIKPEMEGVWVKVPSLSDPMDAACTAMHLNGLVRLAIRLVRGIEIKVERPTDGAGPGVFELAVFSVFPWFKVRERYELNGTVSRWNRRDLRRGTHQGYLSVLPSGKLQLHLRWAQPHSGSGFDEFCLMGPNELHVMSTLQPEGASSNTCFKTVYVRKQQ